MANRHSRFIQTGRAQLFVGVTALPKPGQGSVELTGGSSGSVNSITVGGVEMLSGPVNFRESLATTAQDVADKINNYVSSPNYHARAIGVTIYIWQQTIATGSVTVTSTCTTITKTDTNISGGAVGDGTALGYVQEGFDLIMNTEWLKETGEDDGVRAIKKFYLGENVQVQCVMKQWDADVLALKFPGQHVTTSGANRIEVPGVLSPGDDMGSYNKVLVLVPDSKAYPALLIRSGSNGGEGSTPIRFRTQETKKLALLIDCFKDESHSATNYPTVGCDLLQNLTL